MYYIRGSNFHRWLVIEARDDNNLSSTDINKRWWLPLLSTKVNTDDNGSPDEPAVMSVEMSGSSFAKLYLIFVNDS